MVAEGVKTSKVVMELGQRVRRRMPIAREVHRVVHEGGTGHRRLPGPARPARRPRRDARHAGQLIRWRPCACGPAPAGRPGPAPSPAALRHLDDGRQPRLRRARPGRPRRVGAPSTGRGWSLDWWIGAEDRWHLPAEEAAVRQQLVGRQPGGRDAGAHPDAAMPCPAPTAPAGRAARTSSWWRSRTTARFRWRWRWPCRPHERRHGSSSVALAGSALAGGRRAGRAPGPLARAGSRCRPRRRRARRRRGGAGGRRRTGARRIGDVSRTATRAACCCSRSPTPPRCASPSCSTAPSGPSSPPSSRRPEQVASGWATPQPRRRPHRGAGPPPPRGDRRQHPLPAARRRGTARRPCARPDGVRRARHGLALRAAR